MSHAIDYESFFSALQRSFTTDMNLSPDEPEGQGAWLRSLRIRNFYGCASSSVRAVTAWQTQRAFDPESFRQNERAGQVLHNNKWRGYQQGRTEPRFRTIESASIIGGIDLHAEMRHVLWEALDVEVDMTERARQIISRLPAPLRKVGVAMARTLRRSRPDRYDECDRRRAQSCCDALWAQVSLKSLATATVLYRLAIASGHREIELMLLRCTIRLLMALAEELERRHIAGHLVRYYLELIFAPGSACEVFETPNEIVRAGQCAAYLAYAPTICESGILIGTEKNSLITRVMDDATDGRLRMAFEPVLCPTGQQINEAEAKAIVDKIQSIFDARGYLEERTRALQTVLLRK